MIRSHLLNAAAMIAAAVLTACTDTSTTAPKNPVLGPPPVVLRSGALHLATVCSQYTGLAGSSCTIASSNIAEIAVGSPVIYASAVVTAALHSDVVVDPPLAPENAAFGHCDLDLATGSGQCTFSEGTGTLAGFRASAVAAYAGGNIWYWDGTYSFVQ
jgi:hypothetical protein